MYVIYIYMCVCIVSKDIAHIGNVCDRSTPPFSKRRSMAEYRHRLSSSMTDLVQEIVPGLQVYWADR